MAVDSASSEKKSSNAVNELLTFNAENMQSNMKTIYYRFRLTVGYEHYFEYII